MKRKALMKTYEGMEINYKYKELKATLALRKDKWLEMCQQQVQYA